MPSSHPGLAALGGNWTQGGWNGLGGVPSPCTITHPRPSVAGGCVNTNLNRSWGMLNSDTGQPLQASRNLHRRRPRLQISGGRESPGRGIEVGGQDRGEGCPRISDLGRRTQATRPRSSPPSAASVLQERRWSSRGFGDFTRWSPPLVRPDSSACDSAPGYA